jgi:signal transduction histidine kinase
VAGRWRFRHKLMLGLGLVVGIIVLLLASTLYGLAKFRATLKSTDSKVAELQEAAEFKTSVQRVEASLEKYAGNSVQLMDLRTAIQAATAALDAYDAKLQDTLSHGRDPNNGLNESGLVEVLRHHLAALEAAVDKTRHRATAIGLISSQKFADDPTIKSLIRSLARDSEDLRKDIYDELSERNKEGRKTFQSSLWILFTTSILGVALLCVLMGLFQRWVFDPIRDLQQGAGRVAQGDFAYRIEVHSGDEMEDLAKAFNDMTSRLCDMYRDLARQVNERSRQLVRSERLAGVGFLAAGVAHEINNPLASIAFCSEALEGRLASVMARFPDDHEVVTKYLRMIQQEAFRCKAITQRLLEFSRGGERRREPTDLVELVQAVLEVVQHLQNCKGKTIAFEPANRQVAWINAQEIKSVILNLVVNALDSMDDGGVLTIYLRQKDEMAELVFADTGCGMTAEILENIFEPFFTRSRTGKGTGLGLSISHRVISQHGGEIEAASPGLNQGSTFTVRLPLQSAEQSKEESLGHAA